MTTTNETTNGTTAAAAAAATDPPLEDHASDEVDAGESSQPQKTDEAATKKNTESEVTASVTEDAHAPPSADSKSEPNSDSDNNNNNSSNNSNNNNNNNSNNTGTIPEASGNASRKDPPVLARRPTKRARTAYFIFADEIRPTVQKEHPGETVASQAKRIGARWKSIPQSEKERFQALAAREKEVARSELEAYRALYGDQALDDAHAHADNNDDHEGDLVFPVARIRKIAKLDPEVKTLSKEALQLVVKSTEMALAKLGAECVKVARIQNRRTLLPEDVAHVCAHRDVFGFLRDDIKDLALALAERKNNDGSSSSSSAAAAGASGSGS